MKQNPCRHCLLSEKYKNMHVPSWKPECGECEKLKEHRKYLETKRKFIEGAPIKTLEELLKQEYVMWYHQTRHIEAIKHTQLATILHWLDRGAFHMAVRKESEDNK